MHEGVAKLFKNGSYSKLKRDGTESIDIGKDHTFRAQVGDFRTRGQDKLSRRKLHAERRLRRAYTRGLGQ